MINTMTENFTYGTACFDLQTVAPLTEASCTRINGMIIPEFIREVEQIIRPNGVVPKRSTILRQQQQLNATRSELTRRMSDPIATVQRTNEATSEAEQDPVTSISAPSVEVQSVSNHKTTTKRDRRASYRQNKGGAAAGRGTAAAGRGATTAGRAKRSYPIDALIAASSPSRSTSVDREDDHTSSDSDQRDDRGGRGKTGRGGMGRGKTRRQSKKSSTSPAPCPEQEYGNDSDGENINPKDNILDIMRQKSKELKEKKVKEAMLTGQATIAEVKATFGNAYAKEYEEFLKAIAPVPEAVNEVQQLVQSAAAQRRGRRSAVAPPPAEIAPAPAAQLQPLI